MKNSFVSKLRFWWLIPTILLGVFYFFSFFHCFAQAPVHRTLLFLGNKNIAPVIYLDGNTPSGVAADIVRALTKHISQPIEIRAMDWLEAQKSVATGEADALIQINQTEERKKTYDFSDPLLESHFSIFTSTSRMGITGITSLRGLRVGVELGGLPQQLLIKDPQIQLVIIPNFLDGFKKLNAGSIDALVVDYRVGSYVIASNNLRNIKIVGEPINSSYSSFAVKKGNTRLLNEINTALQSIRSDGTYQKILDKWKPTEVIFETEEQIQHQIMFIMIFFLIILLITSSLWIFFLRKELSKRIKAEKYVKKIISSANVIIVCLDLHGNVMELNEAGEKITGYRKDEILHQNWFELIVPRKKYQKICTECNFISSIVTKSGEERIIEWRNSELYENDVVIGTISYGIDITDRKHSEEQLRYSEQKFSAAFHAAPYLIAITKSDDGTIIDVNEGYTRLLGYSKEESVGRTTAELNIWKIPTDRDRFVLNLKKKGLVYNFKTILRRKDGIFVTVLDSAQFVKINGENCILSLAYDITKEAQLEEAKNEFLNLLAHNMRTIPGTIRWIMELLEPKIEKCLTAKDMKLWHSLDDSDIRLIELADVVSAASQEELEKKLIVPIKFDLIELIDRKIHTYQQIIETKKLKIIRDYQGVKEVILDQNLVEKVISALLSNAIRYTQSKGTVKITLSSVDHTIKLNIKDSGLGIPKNQQDKVFNKFFRAKNVVKIDVVGLGLGLYIAKRIVERLKGKIWFESEEKKGSTFYLELPY